MYSKTATIFFSILLNTAMAFCQQSDSIKVVKPGAPLVQVSKQFKFTEGPAADKKGNIFFTDQPNDEIWKYDIDGELSLFMKKAGRANGMYFDKKGNLVTCSDEQNEIWAITQKKESNHFIR